MNLFGKGKKTENSISEPASRRLELMGAKLPAEKLGEFVLHAATSVKANEAIAPEVAAYVDPYVAAFEAAIAAQQEARGEDALIEAGAPMFAAGHALRQNFGDPVLGTHGEMPDGLAGAVNSRDARTAVENAMGQAYYEMLHPPDRH